MKHLQITISGRVQGVGFRWGVLQKAKKFGIVGFVRNEADGSVYIEAEGEDEQLEKLVAWCGKGPFFGRVDGINVLESPCVGFLSFEIK
jgi:acylphosphatase